MGKTRVHLLAKELGIETKDLIAQLDKLGIRGRKAQSSLEDDEVTRLRAALAVQEKPQVHIGEEKVVADRVVTAEYENLGEIQARETVVERRVRANVICRRTSGVEVVPQGGERPRRKSRPASENLPPRLSKKRRRRSNLPRNCQRDLERKLKFRKSWPVRWRRFFKKSRPAQRR